MKSFLLRSEEKFRQLQTGALISENDIGVHLKLTTIKPLQGRWLVNTYNWMTANKGKALAVKGWARATVAGVLDGTTVLQENDPFADSVDCVRPVCLMTYFSIAVLEHRMCVLVLFTCTCTDDLNAFSSPTFTVRSKLSRSVRCQLENCEGPGEPLKLVAAKCNKFETKLQ